MIGREGNNGAGAADRPLSLESRIALDLADRLRADLDSIASDAQRLTLAIESAIESAGEPEREIERADLQAIEQAVESARECAASAASIAQDRLDAIRREIDEPIEAVESMRESLDAIDRDLDAGSDR